MLTKAVLQGAVVQREVETQGAALNPAGSLEKSVASKIKLKVCKSRIKTEPI